MSTSSKQILETEVIREENGAGALESKQSPKEQRKCKRKYFLMMDNDTAGREDIDESDVQQVLTPVEKAKFAMPPPPPPPTPVQAPQRSTSVAAATAEASVASPDTEDDEANSEKWEDPCAPPPPPPLPTNSRVICQGYVKLTAVKLKDALEEAIMKMESNRREQQQQQQQENFNVSSIEKCFNLQLRALRVYRVHSINLSLLCCAFQIRKRKHFMNNWNFIY